MNKTIFFLKNFNKPKVSALFWKKPALNSYQTKALAFHFSEEITQQKKFIDETPLKEILQIDEKLFLNLNEYKQALFYFSNGKYRISQEFYKRVLIYLENNNNKNSDNYIHILKM